MNRIILLFLCLFLSLSQKVVGGELANITIAFEEQSLRSALCKLEEASQFRFIFQDEVSDTLTVISQRFEYKLLSQILHTLLANTSYSYVVINRAVSSDVIIYKTSKNVQNQEPTLITVRGKVVDDSGESLPGVAIIRRREDGVVSFANIDRKEWTLANLEGYFVITVDNPNTYLVVLTGGSYLPRVVHIKDAELIQLEIDETLEEKWIITGYVE